MPTMVHKPSDIMRPVRGTRQSSEEVDDAEYAKRAQVQRDEQFADKRHFLPVGGTTNNVPGSHRQSRHSSDLPFYKRIGFSYLDGAQRPSINKASDIMRPWSGTRQSSREVDDAEYSKRTQVQRDEQFADKRHFLKQQCEGDHHHGNRVNPVNFERNNTQRNYQPHHNSFGHIREVGPPVGGTTHNVAGSHRQSRHSSDLPFYKSIGFSYLDGAQRPSINKASDTMRPLVLSFETSGCLMTRRSGTRKSSGQAGDIEYARRTQEHQDEDFAREPWLLPFGGATNREAGSHRQSWSPLDRPFHQRQEFSYLDGVQNLSINEEMVRVDRNDIPLLPMHMHNRPTSRKSEEDNTCLVCFNEFKEGETLATLPCCHIYHVDCIDEWLRIFANCPVCRLSAETL